MGVMAARETSAFRGVTENMSPSPGWACARLVTPVRDSGRMTDSRRELQEAIGFQVRRALEEDGLTQQELADAIGLSRRGLHRKLWGQRDFTLIELRSVAVWLDRDLVFSCRTWSDE